MAMIGKVPEFDSKKEDFDSYLERFERWLSANEIAAEKRADVFLSVLGPTEYGLLKNLIAPNKVADISYRDITSALSLHFKPKPILTAERFRFYKRQQKKDETVTEYLLALKELASTCEFGQFLNDALRDQFVCGLSGEGYHKRLLTKKDLTFKKACDIALALELAHKDTKELREHVDKQTGEVHKVSIAQRDKRNHKKTNNAHQNRQEDSRAKQRFSREKKQQCYRCGKGNHQSNECYYRSETCHGCGKVGHLKRVCKKAKQNDKAQMVNVDDSDDCKDAQGLHPTASKVEAIVNAPAPQNVTELRSFLGLLNYYGKFVANLSTILHPLYQLLQADTPWKWSSQCEDAFKGCKQRLLNSKCLAHYDPEKPLRLACDASPYGVGAVISHVLPSGKEQPIAFASRTLSSSERNYAQIEKEALSIIFGVKKFHKYLYGRKFVLLTDHKPLLTILGPKSAVPTLAALRMQRWALILLAYDYEILYRKSSDHANADALSRLPCKGDTDGSSEEGGVFCVSHVDELPVAANDIATETRLDPILSKVLDLTLTGWPMFVSNPELKPFFVRKDQLSTDQGCILWGSRVIIPPRYRQRLLLDLHDGHPGITRMKALARSFLWWPGLDQEIESYVGQCAACEITLNRPAAAPLHPWSWATSPWEKLHVDFAEIKKQHYLLVVDVYSKWLEVLPTQQTSAEKTTQRLRHLFASYGLPKVLVSDNGPPFTSAEFEQFLRNNGVRHILSPPYHPASNGAVERAVQTFKKA